MGFLFSAGKPVFLSVPLNPTYAERGCEVILNWTYSYNTSSPLLIKWFESSKHGRHIGGASIMSKFGSWDARINRPEYFGRVDYMGNGRILLKNISTTDEGYIGISIDFIDGTALRHHILLNVTSK